MTEKQAWVVGGLVVAAGVVIYLASKREVSATVTAGDPTVTYRARATSAASDDGKIVTVDVQ
jgi:hypothetical protein